MDSIHYYGLVCSIETGQGRGRYLVIRSDSNPMSREDLSPLDMRMLERSGIPRTLPLDVEEIDSEVKLCCKLPLGRSLDGFIREASGKDIGLILELLHSIVSIMESSRNYMLDEGKYVLHPSLIQVGRDMDDLYLAYLPLRILENKRSVRQELYQLTLFLLDESGVGHDACPLLLDCLKSSLFDLVEFKRLLIRLRTELVIAAAEISDQRCATDVTWGNLQSDYRPNHAVSKPAANLPASTTPYYGSTVSQPSNPMQAPHVEESLLNDGDTFRFHPKSWTLAGKGRLRLLLTAIILIWGAAAWKPSEELLSLSVGLTLVTAAYYYKCKRSEKDETWKGETTDDPLFDPAGSDPACDDVPMLCEQNELPTGQNSGTAVRTFDWSEAERKLYADTPAQTVFLMQPAETELLFPETELLHARALLEIQTGDAPQIIELNKDYFVFGRSPEESDWVLETSGISRKHGVFIREGGEWSVMDAGSKNGCCLNGEPLVSNRSYRLKNGDRITAAQTEFIFRLP